MVNGVLTAADVEAAANGNRRIQLDERTVVTPLARDRAGALDVLIVDRSEQLPASRASLSNARGDGGSAASAVRGAPAAMPADRLARLRLESVVRAVARRILLEQGVRLDLLEDTVAAVLDRLDGNVRCSCGGQDT